MAWQFRVSGKRITEAGVSVGVEYFDPNIDARKVLAKRTFDFAPGTTSAEAVTRIKDEGRQVRSKLAQAQALADTFTVNESSTIS